MPRTSLRKRALTVLEREHERRQLKQLIHGLHADDSSSSNEEFEEETDVESEVSVEDVLTHLTGKMLEQSKRQRFMFRPSKYRKGKGKDIMDRDLEEDTSEEGLPPWLTDEDFLQKYRVRRESFYKLLAKIEDHPVFKAPDSRGRKQASPALQLMAFLHYLGCSANGGSNSRLRQVFCGGKGTFEEYKRRVVGAIRSLREEAISWPDEEERVEIAQRVRGKFEWWNCIAVADGTLFPLTSEPECEDASDYHGRKFGIAIRLCLKRRKNILGTFTS